MKVFELLTMINKPRYKVEVYDRSDLRGGVFTQGELKVGLLNRKVGDYKIYKPFKTISIHIKELE